MKNKYGSLPVRRGVSKRQWREWLRGYAFISPWIIGVCVFFLYAAIRSLQFSFNDFSLDQGIKLTPLPHFLDNYAYIFNFQPNFVLSLQGFTLSMVLHVPMIVAFALIIAMLLNGKFKGRGFYRTLFFLPVAIATGAVMDTMTNAGGSGISIYSVSALANMLSQMPSFVFETFNSLFGSIVTNLWLSGVPMLIFLAGLQKVPDAQYEAARIDGASPWEVFWKITAPSIRPFVLINTVYTIVFLSGNSNAVIDQITIATYLAGMGYDMALAMSWVYAMVIILMLLVVYFILRERSDRRVQYEQGREAAEMQQEHRARMQRERTKGGTRRAGKA